MSVATNGVRLHVVQAGPEEGPLVLLLHGFPEGWRCWRRQIGALAERGWRVWAPDQRGYGESDRPGSVAGYRLGQIGADAIGLIEAAGVERAHVVGHDWGGAVAWWLAAHHPERVERLVVLNCPHPAVMQRAVMRNPRQMLKSWYILFFQLPWLPEWMARVRDHGLLTWGLRSSSRPGTFGETALEEYRTEWSRPGALRAMIHWYRAMRRPPSIPDAKIRPPSLLIWGCRDRALGRELAAPSIATCVDGRLEEIENATHWVQHEEAQRVTALIDAHLRCKRPDDPN